MFTEQIKENDEILLANSELLRFAGRKKWTSCLHIWVKVRNLIRRMNRKLSKKAVAD